jgi:hypothetical protein
MGGKKRSGSKNEGMKGAFSSKVVFYMHLQLIKDNILFVVFCYTLTGVMS